MNRQKEFREIRGKTIREAKLLSCGYAITFTDIGGDSYTLYDPSRSGRFLFVNGKLEDLIKRKIAQAYERTENKDEVYYVFESGDGEGIYVIIRLLAMDQLNCKWVVKYNKKVPAIEEPKKFRFIDI